MININGSQFPFKIEFTFKYFVLLSTCSLPTPNFADRLLCIFNLESRVIADPKWRYYAVFNTLGKQW